MTTITPNTFAAACYDQNSLVELHTALAGEADKTDCETWNLTPAQWRAEIELAISARVERDAS